MGGATCRVVFARAIHARRNEGIGIVTSVGCHDRAEVVAKWRTTEGGVRWTSGAMHEAPRWKGDLALTDCALERNEAGSTEKRTVADRCSHCDT